MSVPVNQRTTGKMEVCIKSRDLAVYTLQITKNKNIFSVDYQDAITDKIISTALNIHSLVWAANNILVNSHQDMVERLSLQDKAAAQCNVLLSLIDIAKPLFHLKTKRVMFWGEVYPLVENILREQYEGEKGYNPGSQLIQIAGISVLDGYDHYAKEQLHAKFYIRYMDDFMIISHDHKYLERCVEQTREFLAGLKFEMNEKKTCIHPLSDGIEFLGFKYHLTETGKVLMLVKSANVKRERRKLRRLVALSKRGKLPREKVDESYAAWRNHASKGSSKKLLARMDRYYKDLWRTNNGAVNKKQNGSA